MVGSGNALGLPEPFGLAEAPGSVVSDAEGEASADPLGVGVGAGVGTGVGVGVA